MKVANTGFVRDGETDVAGAAATAGVVGIWKTIRIGVADPVVRFMCAKMLMVCGMQMGAQELGSPPGGLASSV